MGAKVAELARQKLDLSAAALRDEHFYASLPLCAIDAVFSIGVNYTATRNTVLRWAQSQSPQWAIDRRLSAEDRSISEFLAALGTATADELANGPFGNRQRTSSRNGILKTEAVRQFAISLRSAGIERFADVCNEDKLSVAESAIRQIPGQKSGISFDYFLLLAGQDFVKADRMICRFVASAAGIDMISPAVAKIAVIDAARLLKVQFPHLDARLLDSEIWGYESAKAARKNAKSKSK
ncbi:MAG: hypothetical protein ACOY5F_05605 [Pseudomonadota bacterium]